MLWWGSLSIVIYTAYTTVANIRELTQAHTSDLTFRIAVEELLTISGPFCLPSRKLAVVGNKDMDPDFKQLQRHHLCSPFRTSETMLRK